MTPPHRRCERIRFRGDVGSRAEVRPLLERAGDTVLVTRAVPRSLVMRCPCGCGDDLVLNLDPRAGDAWRLFRRRRGVSVYPSYWRETACASHFIIWNDAIFWCDWRSGQDPDYRESAISEKVALAFVSSEWADHRTVAAELDEIPWDVLWTARRLVRDGRLEEQEWPQTGWFRSRRATIGPTP